MRRSLATAAAFFSAYRTKVVRERGLGFGINDADALAAEYAAAGATIRQLPTNFPWAYEMQVQDPDGNVLRFGSDSQKDHPFGEFLDMRGRGWPMPEGSKVICEDYAGNYAQYAVLRASRFRR